MEPAKPYRAIANNYKNISTGILFNKLVIEKRSHHWGVLGA
jgi:hypothetical protein